MPTLFVSVGGAPVLFTLFVFVEELMSCLRYLCQLEYLLSYFTLFVFVGELLSYLRYLCL